MDSGPDYMQRVDSGNDESESSDVVAVVGVDGTAIGADTGIEAGTEIEAGAAIEAGTAVAVSVAVVVADEDKGRKAIRVVSARGVELVRGVVVLRKGLCRCEVVGVGKKRSGRGCWEKKKEKRSCCTGCYCCFCRLTGD